MTYFWRNSIGLSNGKIFDCDRKTTKLTKKETTNNDNGLVDMVPKAAMTGKVFTTDMDGFLLPTMQWWTFDYRDCGLRTNDIGFCGLFQNYQWFYVTIGPWTMIL